MRKKPLSQSARTKPKQSQFAKRPKMNASSITTKTYEDSFANPVRQSLMQIAMNHEQRTMKQPENEPDSPAFGRKLEA
jgi:hypothetical protein